jgi:hypothetical protein
MDRLGKSRAAIAKAIACALLLASSTFNTVRAQHASDDPVASANDGFGLTLGLESIGLYGPGFVRGFNPQTAGNVRIDGLYFDQHGALSNRVVEGSAIRIGISEIGYAFPAPTGIVDYDLRRPGNGTPRDRTELWSAGIAYRAQWQGHGDFTLGVQQESYSKDVTSPALPEMHLTDRPLRAYGTAALALTGRATVYAGYTQGLEDSGVASTSAENRGAILPDARTWQADTGIKYLLNPRVKLIAGIFEIEKPYFNLHTTKFDRALGQQRATGLELSASGEVIRNFNVAAAVLWGEVKVIGPNLKAEGVGSIALNQAKFTATINASYILARHPALSADISILHFGPYPASVDDVAQAPEGTTVALGGRYRFKILGARATLRVQAQNLTNIYFWNLSYNAPSFTQYQPRTFLGYPDR